MLKIIMQRKEETLEKVISSIENCEQAKRNYYSSNPQSFIDLINYRNKCGFFKKFLDYQKKTDDRTYNIEKVFLKRD